MQVQWFITFLDSQKKQSYNVLKEKQKFRNYYKWLNKSNNAKLTDTKLQKLENLTAIKNKAESTLIMSLKIFDGNSLPHELLLTTRQKTKLRNALNNTMSTDLKPKFKALKPTFKDF